MNPPTEWRNENKRCEMVKKLIEINKLKERERNNQKKKMIEP